MNHSVLKSVWFSSGKILSVPKRKILKINIFNEAHVSHFKYDNLYFSMYI